MELNHVLAKSQAKIDKLKEIIEDINGGNVPYRDVKVLNLEISHPGTNARDLGDFFREQFEVLAYFLINFKGNKKQNATVQLQLRELSNAVQLLPNVITKESMKTKYYELLESKGLKSMKLWRQLFGDFLDYLGHVKKMIKARKINYGILHHNEDMLDRTLKEWGMHMI